MNDPMLDRLASWHDPIVRPSDEVADRIVAAAVAELERWPVPVRRGARALRAGSGMTSRRNPAIVLAASLAVASVILGTEVLRRPPVDDSPVIAEGPPAGTPAVAQTVHLPAAALLTIAGGHTDLAAPAALHQPEGLAWDRDGRLLVGEAGTIRAVEPDGTLVRVAGTGAVGSSGDGGPATEALLRHPSDIAVGPDGSIYFSTIWHSSIRRIAPDGTIDTVVGRRDERPGTAPDGALAAGSAIGTPYDVTVGPDGLLYFSELSEHRVRRVTEDGRLETVAGAGVARSERDTEAPFTQPTGLAFDHRSGDLYIAARSGSVHRLDRSGRMVTVAGPGLGRLSDIAVDGNGVVYVLDDSTYTVSRLAPDGTLATVVAPGAYPTTDGRRVAVVPTGLGVDRDGVVHVADSGTHAVYRLLDHVD